MSSGHRSLRRDASQVAVLLGLFAGTAWSQDLPAGHPPVPSANPAPPRVSSRRNIEDALAEVLSTEDRKQIDAFTELVSAVNRAATQAGLPSFWEQPDSLYTPEYLAFRARWYGPLRSSEKGLALLHRLARDSGVSKYDEMTACMILADDPTVTDVRVMLEGLRATESKASHRISRSRQLGRALARLDTREDAAAAVVEEALAFFREEVRDAPHYDKGAAVEGLSRAGQTAEALEALRAILTGDDEPAEMLEVLQACPRMLEMPGFDPFLKAKAVAVAREVAETAAVEGLEQDRLTRAVTSAATSLRAAIDFLRDVSPETQMDFFLECFGDPDVVSVLGMDGIQNLRYALQQGRKKVSREQARRMDRVMLDVLVRAGDRLWALTEEPMTEDEWRTFHQDRDLRYNAGSYFEALWDKEPDVREGLAEEPDLPEFLRAIVASDELQGEGEGEDALYHKVRDKDETRLLSATLLAYMERDLGVPCEEPDLYALFVGFVAQEVYADREAVAEALARQVEIGSTDLLLEIPVVKKPWDAWIKNKAVDALGILGCEVIDVPGRVQVRLPRATGRFAVEQGS